MSKKTKIAGVCILFLIILACILIFTGERKEKVKIMYEKMKKSNSFTLSMEEKTTEINYKVSMAQRGQDISIDMYSDEEHTTTLILENKSYFIMHDDQEYYDYGDEKIDSDIVLSSLKNIVQKTGISGKEEIDGKTYYYEEYENKNMDFIIFANINESSKVKTRFYFIGNDLCYIKNIIQSDDGNQEELIKTVLKFEVDEKLFDIPDNYAEVMD